MAAIESGAHARGTRRTSRCPALGLHHAGDQRADRLDPTKWLLCPRGDQLDDTGEVAPRAALDADDEAPPPGLSGAVALVADGLLSDGRPLCGRSVASRG